MVFVLLPTAAFAQTDGGSGAYPTTPTTPTTQVQGTVATKPVQPAGTSSLALTGGDIALLSVLGVAAVASGSAILLFSRRRSTPAES